LHFLAPVVLEAKSETSTNQIRVCLLNLAKVVIIVSHLDFLNLLSPNRLKRLILSVKHLLRLFLNAPLLYQVFSRIVLVFRFDWF